MNYSRLLINEPPLMVTPSLAVAVGLNEALFLQQLHYWLEKSTHVHDGYKWVYNTYDGWIEQFPFWSVSTIRRAIKSLEDQNLIIAGNYNKMKIDNTKWYRIDYSTLEAVSSPSVQNEQTHLSNLNSPSVQNEQTHLSNMNRPLPEITTEITTEITQTKDSCRKRPVYNPDSLEMKIASYFFERILLNNPNHKKPNLQTWADDIRKMLEIDNRPKEELGNLIKWVQTDDFEMSNVLSPAKLRKRYDALVIKMKNTEGAAGHGKNGRRNGKNLSTDSGQYDFSVTKSVR